MKKVLRVVLLLAASGVMVQPNLFAGGAYDDARNTSRDGDGATREPTHDGARAGSGQGFDTNSSNPVDLSGKRGVVDPNDLKQNDPPKPSLRIHPPPPLP